MLRNQVLFRIDETSMIPSHALDAIDRCLQDITGVDCTFRGKISLLGGDFRQVLPVIDAYIKWSPIRLSSDNTNYMKHAHLPRLTGFLMMAHPTWQWNTQS